MQSIQGTNREINKFNKISNVMDFFSNVKLKNILNAKPVSNQFGCDRGKPIDRFYIEKFLSTHTNDIKGNVLEVSENQYTMKFGKQITSSAVFNFERGSNADIVGDLCDIRTLSENSVDCFICTQTFNFIYDFKAAIVGARYLLKPGGVLLATVACLAPISKYDSDRWGDFWRFTPQSCMTAFGNVFGEQETEIMPLGNSASASLFMKGYALEDLPRNFDLDFNDGLFPLIIGVRAIK
jgi:hypothetical protein